MNISNLVDKVKVELRQNKYYIHNYLNFELIIDRYGFIVYKEESYKNCYKNIKQIVEDAIDSFYCN